LIKQKEIENANENDMSEREIEKILIRINNFDYAQK